MRRRSQSRRSTLLALAATLSLLALACGASNGAPVGPTGGTCGAACERSCDARCSQSFAQCEAACDSSTPMDLGNTGRQAIVPREGNADCRRICQGQDQNCERTCNAECRPCSS